MDRFLRSFVLVALATLAGCRSETYDECLQDAAEDAKSVAALEVLKGVCNRKYAEDRVLVKKAGKYDKLYLTPAQNYFSGEPSLEVIRSSMERTENGIKASVIQLFPVLDLKENIRRLFDPTGEYDSMPKSQLEGSGVKEFDCRNNRTRWLELSTKLYVADEKEQNSAVLSLPAAGKNLIQEEVGSWTNLQADSLRYDFDYVCYGKISPQTLELLKYDNVCGENYSGSCKTQ